MAKPAAALSDTTPAAGGASAASSESEAKATNKRYFGFGGGRRKAANEVLKPSDAPAKIPLNLKGYNQTYLVEALKAADREDEDDDDDDDDAVHEHRALFRCVARERCRRDRGR
jgi:hypothetical protein